MSDWTTAPTLVGRHVTLQPLVVEDLPALVAVAAEGDLWDTFYASVSGLKNAEAWWAATEADARSGRSLPMAVVDVRGTVVGTTRYCRINPTHRRLEVGGTFYARSVQRTGVNTDAKLLLLTYAFEALGCQCVQLRTDLLNLRSQAAITRLGATRDGVLRGHQIMDGRLRDTVCYSILDREWPGVRRNLEHLLEQHA